MMTLVVSVGVFTILLARLTEAAPAEDCMDGMMCQDVSVEGTHRQQNVNQVDCTCMPVYECKNNTRDEYYGENVIDIRIDQSECPHYLEKCCSIPSDQLKPSPRPAQPYTPSCGTRHADGISFKITGNTDEASYGEFPWMVAVLRKNHTVNEINPKPMECGGSIIHPQVVLTGAHCVRRKSHLFIRAAEWDTKTDKELYPSQERDVKSVIIHEEFYAGGLFNDIALLVLERPLELNEVVDSICLPNKGEIMDGRNCVVSGWGKDSFGTEGKYQEILKKVELPMVPRSSCQDILRTTSLGKDFKLHQSFLCAGGIKGRDACKGDGGGPLVCPSKDNPNRYLQAGIVAWGVGCGNATPAVYVNVPHFRSWIDDKLRSLHLI